jgi:hypothetical protein
VTRGEAFGWSTGPSSLERLLRSLALLRAATDETPFAARPDRHGDPILVVRKGDHPGFGRVVEA